MIAGKEVPIFASKLFQKEGGLPIFRFITTKKANIRKGDAVTTTHFDGFVSDAFAFDPYFMRVEAVINYGDVRQKCLDLISEPEILFGDKDHPIDRLEGLPCLFHFRRMQKDIVLSDLTKASKTLTYDGDVLSYRLKRKEPKKFQVRLQAKWMKRTRFMMDLFPMIQARFPNSSVETLTGKNFEKAWPAFSLMQPQSGYVVLESSLKQRASGFSVPFRIQDKITYVRKTTFEGTLKILAHEEQKMMEEVSFEVGEGERIEHLLLKVPDLNDFNGSSFFPSTLGKVWLAHALAFARNKHLANRRGITLEIVLPMSDFFETIDLDTFIIVAGIGKGRVMAYEVEDNRLLKLTLVDLEEEALPSFNLDLEEPEEDEMPWIQAIEVTNPCVFQNQYLAGQDFESEESVRIPPTRINVVLKSLARKKIKLKTYLL